MRASRLGGSTSVCPANSAAALARWNSARPSHRLNAKRARGSVADAATAAAQNVAAPNFRPRSNSTVSSPSKPRNKGSMVSMTADLAALSAGALAQRSTEQRHLLPRRNRVSAVLVAREAPAPIREFEREQRDHAEVVADGR